MTRHAYLQVRPSSLADEQSLDVLMGEVDMMYTPLVEGLMTRGYINTSPSYRTMIGIYRYGASQTEWPKYLCFVHRDPSDGSSYVAWTMPGQTDQTWPTSGNQVTAIYIKQHYNMPFDVDEYDSDA